MRFVATTFEVAMSTIPSYLLKSLGLGVYEL